MGTNYGWVSGSDAEELYIVEAPTADIHDAQAIRTIGGVPAGDILFVENYERRAAMKMLEEELDKQQPVDFAIGCVLTTARLQAIVSLQTGERRKRFCPLLNGAITAVFNRHRILKPRYLPRHGRPQSENPKHKANKQQEDGHNAHQRPLTRYDSADEGKQRRDDQQPKGYFLHVV